MGWKSLVIAEVVVCFAIAFHDRTDPVHYPSPVALGTASSQRSAQQARARDVRGRTGVIGGISRQKSS